MKISIIIPVYNVEPYIERCLLSALNQTYQNIEIILVDDCGQDNSVSIAKQLIENHENGHKAVILKHEQNCGLSVARNTGIKAAKGEYVYFFDSDDEITLDCLETLIKEADGFEVVIGGVVSRTGELYFKNKKNIFTGEEIRTAHFNGLIYDMAWNKLTNREFILKNNLFFEPGLIHEDYPWTFFVSMKCNKLKIIEDKTYIYYIRENTLSTNFTIKNIQHYITGFNKIESFLIENIDTSDKYVYLTRYRFMFKYQAFIKTAICYSDFKKLSFSKYKYPVQTNNFTVFCKGIVLKLPVFLQYVILNFTYILKYVKHK